MESAQGKSNNLRLSLLQPQPLAQQFLPPWKFDRLLEWGTNGVPVDCGSPWLQEAIEAALDTGPHVSALTPAAIQLIQEDIQYQVDAGFADIMLESELRQDMPPNLKVSRAAVVPQHNRRATLS